MMDRGPALARLFVLLLFPFPAIAEPLPPLNREILEGARAWLERDFRYDTAYIPIDYPGGDIHADRGACVDVVVRSLRHAGIDLQVLIYEDRVGHRDRYDDGTAPDPNIDHRRAATQVVFMGSHAVSLTPRTDGDHLQEWLPGDLVYYGRTRVWHVAIVSDRKSAGGIPYIIDSHPDADGISEKHLLMHWGTIHSHFRITERMRD